MVALFDCDAVEVHEEFIDASRKSGGERTHFGLVVVELADESNLRLRETPFDDRGLDLGQRPRAFAHTQGSLTIRVYAVDGHEVHGADRTLAGFALPNLRMHCAGIARRVSTCVIVVCMRLRSVAG